MLDLPRVVVAEPVGQLDLVEAVLEELVLARPPSTAGAAGARRRCRTARRRTVIAREFPPTAGRGRAVGMLGRIVIDAVRPATPSGYPAKAVVGERVPVSADDLPGRPRHPRRPRPVVAGGQPRGARHRAAASRRERRMARRARARAHRPARVRGRGVDRPLRDVAPRRGAEGRRRAATSTTELEEGARLLECLAPLAPDAAGPKLKAAVAALRDDALPLDDAPERRARRPRRPRSSTASPTRATSRARRSHALWVDRERARSGAWYELFPAPRAASTGATKRLPAIAEMGFDVVYLPPDPPDRRDRTARAATTRSRPAPTTPAARGPSAAPRAATPTIHPDLGTHRRLRRASSPRPPSLGMEVALDYALQCSPDHPWVTSIPSGSTTGPTARSSTPRTRPRSTRTSTRSTSGRTTTRDRVALWEACKDILDHWIAHGVRIFRVDNPHTKPLAFWEWLHRRRCSAEHPDVVFLAEAFTRPKVMAKLAEVGFSQSYTYFTWRTSKLGARASTSTELAPRARRPTTCGPTSGPTRPTSSSGPLRNGPPAAFTLRFVLAATLVPSLRHLQRLRAVRERAGVRRQRGVPALREVRDEARATGTTRRRWRRSSPRSTRSGARHPAFAELRNIRFHRHRQRRSCIAYSKRDADGSDVVLVRRQPRPAPARRRTRSTLDLGALGLAVGRSRTRPTTS